MQENIIKTLKNSGLGTRKMEIYLAVLNLGKATVMDIARKSKIKRTTLYQYLDEMSKKNLLIKTVKGKRIYYMAADPQKIVKIMERQKKEVEKILPELEKIYLLATHKPQIRFYEGIEGMREIYREMTSTSQTIYGVFSADKYLDIFNNKDIEDFFHSIRSHGGKLYDLTEDTPIARKHIKSSFYKGLGTPKILPKDFNISVDLLIAGNKIAMISLINLIGIIIENTEIAELQRSFVKFIRKNIK